MNSGRHSGRVEPERANLQLSRDEQQSNANDSVNKKRRVLPPKVERVSAIQMQRVDQSLTDQDRSVVQAMGTIRIATGQQLRCLFWPDTETGKRMARHHLAKLVELRVLARLDRRVGGVRAGSEGFTYTLDVVGQRLVDQGQHLPRRLRRPRTPGPSFLDHELAVSEAYVVLHELDGTGRVHLEHFEAEPACWRTYSGTDGERRIVKPDALAITSTTEFEDAWFLEIDRGTEHPGRITAKAHIYVDYATAEARSDAVLPIVLFVAPNVRRAKQITEAIRQLDPEHWRLFQVCTDEQFADVVIAGPGAATNQPDTEGGEP